MLQKTLFDNNYFRTLLQWFSLTFFRFKRWQLVGAVPPTITKYVIAATPHTTWLDLPYSLMIASHFKIQMYWIGKEELFKWPFKGFLRWLGGVAVKRNSKTNKTEYFGALLREAKGQVQLVVAPAGTRKNLPVKDWKRGYYDIAVKGNVPIVFFFINYKRREAGVGMIFFPTGNYDNDLETIEEFYREYIGENLLAT